MPTTNPADYDKPGSEGQLLADVLGDRLFELLGGEELEGEQ